MPFTSSTDLLTWLSQNLFLNPQQVDELHAFLADNSDLHSFCKELLRREWLTPFQMNQLLRHDTDMLVVGANRLHSKLGEGAMGQVYRAWNVRLGRMVAVKTLHPDHTLNVKAMERFRRETQTAAALDHPNIVLLRDADEHNRVPYLVMDYFDGIDLSRKMKEEGPQPIPQAAEFIRQAALGLQHAYERGVVHRDIKPSNILIVKTADGSTVVKILDFGLAKFEREEDGQQPLTQAGRLIGTVDFIAPEQATDAHTADIRADIYSLGCTLFYLLTGKAPFAGGDHLEKLTARINGEPPRLRDFCPDAPAELETVLRTMMARDPANRFQTPQEAALALGSFCPAGRPAMLVANFARPMVAAPVIQALPVTSAVADQALTAQPVEAEAVAVVEEPAEFPFGPGPSAFVDGDDGDFPPERPRPAKRPPIDLDEDEDVTPPTFHKPLMFGMLGFLVLILLVTTAFFFFRTTETIVEPNLGTMKLQLDSPPDRVWAYGARKPVLVKVARHEFSGPVTLAVDPAPWMQCQPTTIASKNNVGELRIIIPFHADLGPHTVKITASSPNSQPASIEYLLEIVAAQP